MDKKIVTTIIGAVALSGAAMAEPVAGKVEAAAPSNSGNFIQSLQNASKLYKNDNNPYIQEVKIFGRAQLQYAAVYGEDAAGNNQSDNFEDVRRLRFGASVKAFNGFEFKANANLIRNGTGIGGSRSLGYSSFDVATVAYNFGNVMGLDSLKLTYGRHKINMGAESHTSSKKIKTVERSALSNKIYTNRYTGALVSAKRGKLNGTFGVLSLDNSRFIGNWDSGIGLYGSTKVNVKGHDIVLDGFYNLDQGSVDDEVGVGYLAAFSASTVTEFKGWDVMLNAVYGHNGKATGGPGTGGSFWGLVVMPSKFIVDDKIEAVVRYQYQGSSKSNGIRMNSRYARRLTGFSRSGDQHHSLYAGLNYYFIGHNSKAMIGVEGDYLDTTAGGQTSTTLWAAYRMYF